MITTTGRVTVLGSGTSHGVPMIGCKCAVCLSEDDRDKRMRPSVYVQWDDGTSLLVDTTPDLRSQALRFGVERVDAILFTHCHADHVMGLDEVRRFNSLQKTTIPCIGNKDTLADLRRIFSYAFEATDHGGGLPKIELRLAEERMSFGGHEVQMVPVWHGPQLILGYRFGALAYLTDCSAIPETSMPLLEGLQTLIIDAVRRRPHKTHFNVDGALEAIRQINPQKAYLTHLNHELGHAATNASLPAGVELAYDGLVVEF